MEVKDGLKCAGASESQAFLQHKHGGHVQLHSLAAASEFFIQKAAPSERAGNNTLITSANILNIQVTQVTNEPPF